jgi:enoyl-CoA hydratase
MQYQTLLTRKTDQTLMITLNRPDVMNALNRQMLHEILDAIRLLESDESLCGAFFTGAGDRAFAAGADIAELAALDPSEAMKAARFGQEVFFAIEDCPKPVIAAVNGYALGGGCELAMACHLRIASENARFGQPEVKLGLIAGYGGTQRLAQLIGRGKATEMLITGDLMPADEALNWGLVNYVTTRGELVEKCQEVLRKAYQQSPAAIRLTLNAINAGYANRNGREQRNGYEVERENFTRAHASADGQEGMQAFIEKRAPRFSGH